MQPQLHHPAKPIAVLLEQLPERFVIPLPRPVKQLLTFHGIAAHIESPRILIARRPSFNARPCFGNQDWSNLFDYGSDESGRIRESAARNGTQPGPRA